MSSDFKAPLRDDLKRWEVVAYLVRAGLPYFKLYEPIPLATVFGHPNGRPKRLISAQRKIEPYLETMAEAVGFVARHRRGYQAYRTAEALTGAKAGMTKMSKVLRHTGSDPNMARWARAGLKAFRPCPCFWTF